MKKHKLATHICKLILGLGITSQLEGSEITTKFSYQAQLLQQGTPATGRFDFRFSLLDGAGAPIGEPLLVRSLSVENGVVSTWLDFGKTPFAPDAKATALSVGIALEGSDSFTVLDPPQQIGSTPYAVAAGSLTGPLPPSQLPAGIPTLTGENAFSANLTLNANLDFGARPRQMLNLWNTAYGVGVQDRTLYFRTEPVGSFAWYLGGSHVDQQADPGAGGLLAMGLDAAGLRVQGQVAAGSFVGDGRGLSNVQATVPGLGTVRVDGRDLPLIGGSTPGTQGLLRMLATPLFPSGVRQNWDVGVPQGQTRETTIANSFVIDDANATGAPSFLIKGGTGNVGIGIAEPQARLDVAGEARVHSLTITGGADLAEPFEVSEGSPTPGAVMVIDEGQPGRLRQSAEAYDRRVAGVISGANGVLPGLRLRQEGVLDRGQNVALSGRVYVKASASNGSIRPGDLLTTSSLPGHAMKATDGQRSQGAILGKAMTSLDHGEDYVLVLVTLQ